MKKLILTILLIPSLALASFPTDDFESYSAGDLAGNSGGTGWSAAWGTGTNCSTNWDVVSASLSGSGSKSIANTVGNDDFCGRTFTANTTTGIDFDVWINVGQTDNDGYAIVGLSAASVNQMIAFFRSTGQFATYDDNTATNLVAYAQDTSYHIYLQPVDYTDGVETHKLKVIGLDLGNGTSNYSNTYKMFNYTAISHTSSGIFIFNNATPGTATYKGDDIGVTVVAPSVSPKPPDVPWWD